MELFGKEGIFEKLFFSDENEWDKVRRYDKEKYVFMVNRRMAIKFPLQAQALNFNGMCALGVMESWKLFIDKVYGKRKKKSLPVWLYAKSGNKKKTDKDILNKFNEATINLFLQKAEISRKQLDDLIRFYPEETEAYLRKLEKMTYDSIG